MSSAASAPLPFLPLEVKGHILRFCDQGTLAVTSRVSLAFLEMSIPILHDEVYVKDMKTMEKLLCSRAGRAPSGVDALLSLSHVRSLTIVDAEDENSFDWDYEIQVSCDRITNRATISVSDLKLIGLLSAPDECSWVNVYPLLNPETACISPRTTDEWGFVDLRSAPWHNLRLIKLVGASPSGCLGQCDFLRRRPTTGEERPLIVSYVLSEVTNTEDYQDICEELEICLVEDEPELDMFGPGSRLIAVNVRFRTKDQQTEFARSLTAHFAGPFPLSEAARKKRWDMIKFEVVVPADEPVATTSGEA